MSTHSGCCVWLGLALALLVAGVASVAAVARAQPADSLSALHAADHYIQLRGNELTVDTVWVLAAPLDAGREVPLVPPLPHGAVVASSRFHPVSTGGVVTALRAERALAEGEHVRLRTQLPEGTALTVARLPIPTLGGRAIQRVRFSRSVRFEVGADTSLDIAAGIQVGRDIRTRDRRVADITLDGAHAHRRVGALYVRATPAGIDGQLQSANDQRQVLAVVAAGVFLLAAFGVYSLHQRARRVVESERVDAYLASECATEEARALGVQPERSPGVVRPPGAQTW